MLAAMTLQGAIARGLPVPSDCDIVILVLWSRIRTPLAEEWHVTKHLNEISASNGRPGPAASSRQERRRS
jgi:hypothetical protein